MDAELFLFVSVDVVGSSAYKAGFLKRPEATEAAIRSRQDSLGSGPKWLGFFRDFFLSFPSKLIETEIEVRDELARFAKGITTGKQKLAYQTLKEHDKSKFQFWKAAGDEILFFKPLTRASEVWIGVASFKLALERMMTQMHELWNTSPARPRYLKGTAWVAGTPLRNSKIAIGGTDGIDFIGPSIDAGFRLCQFSSPQRFTLSLPLAWMIAKFQDQVKPTNSLQFVYYGRHTLRGTVGGENYPVFAIFVPRVDGGSESPVLKNEQKLMRPVQSTEDVLAFSEAYFKDSETSINPPFIWEDEDKDMFSPDPSTKKAYSKELQTFKRAISRWYDSTASDTRSAAQGSGEDFVNQLDFPKNRRIGKSRSALTPRNSLSPSSARPKARSRK